MIAYKIQEDKSLKDARPFESSVFTVSVLEGQHIPFEEYYLSISVDNINHKTNHMTGAFPTFSEQFRFPGVTLNQNVEFLLCDSGYSSTTLSSVLPISKFSNQRIHDIWIEFKSKDKQNGMFAVTQSIKIHLQIQYIFCRSKIAEEATEEWKKQEKLEQENLNQIQNELNMLYSSLDFLSIVGRKKVGNMNIGQDTMIGVA